MALATARQAFPDRLRGLALLGIIVVNAPFLAISSSGFTTASVSAWWDLVAAFLVITLAQGKFYLLFSFLFGYSAVFIVRTGAAAERRRYRRRLLGLALLGFAHAVLFFIGDILLAYALLGFAFMLLLRRSDRTVVRTAAIVFALSVVWLVLIFALVAVTPPTPDTTTTALSNAIAHGTFLDAARARLAIRSGRCNGVSPSRCSASASSPADGRYLRTSHGRVPFGAGWLSGGSCSVCRYRLLPLCSRCGAASAWSC